MDTYRRPEAIFFDAGGTLVLQDPFALSALLGSPIDDQAAFDAHYRTMAAFSRRRIDGFHDTWEWWQEQYFRALRVDEPTTAGARIGNGYGLWSLPLPGAIVAVGELRSMGIRMGVISNSDGSVRRSLDEAGFGGFFELVVDSHEVGVSKPDPAIFLYALDQAGVSAASAWYVGDSMFHDVNGARAAGLARAFLIDPLHLHPEYSDRILGVEGLLSFLSDLEKT